MTTRLSIKILDQRIGNEFPLPKYQTPGSAGFDLIAAVDEEFTLQPGEQKLVPTGLSIHIKEPGLAGHVLSRSGLASKKIVVGQGTGLIDSDYTGQVQVILYNRSQTDSFKVEAGMRIAQFVLVPIIQAEFEYVQEHEQTSRGEGGFNSTGLK